mmetsp:Transcript_69187/g.162774  ORF Transcript_69187/g.162774 Transcript_69187/m.162774 type:complete len:85 (-) Transcript_69187:8-262(-)
MVYVAAENGGKEDGPSQYRNAFGMGLFVTLLSILQGFLTIFIGSGTEFPKLSTLTSRELYIRLFAALFACVILFIIIFFGIAQQ